MEVTGMKRLIDLTHVITNSLPSYPGDSKTDLIQTKNMQEDKYTNFQLEISMHSGTHIDGPMHLTDSTEYINEKPLHAFIGDGCPLNVCNEAIIEYKEEYEVSVKENSIVLLYTGHSELYGKDEYFRSYPVISKGLAELLVKKQVKMVGLDTPSPDKVPFEIHKYFFENHVLIIENLTNLKELLNEGDFEVIALPLKIKADSSIARVIARVK